MKAVSFIVAAAAVSSAFAACNPTFPKDWSAIIINDIELNQGGVKTAQGLLCPFEAPQCKVQTAKQIGAQYFDYTNQRTAFLGPDGSGIVTLIKEGKEFQVDSNGTCQAYCPVQGSLYPLSTNNATDMGAVTYNGKTVELFQSKEIFPILNITMEIDNFYVDCSNPSNAVPVAEVDLLTPFGQSLGSQNQTWANFKGGPQNPAKFVVNGMASCPEANNCGGSDDSNSATLMRMTPLMREYLREATGIDFVAAMENAARRV